METITIGGVTMSVPCNELGEALAAAQMEMDVAKKGAENTFFKKKDGGASMYADLDAIIGATRPCLPKHGISLTQMPFDDEGRIGMTTMLIHKSGQFIAGTFSMKPSQDTPQADGSCLTYLRRYTAAPACGVAISDATDDDGNEGTKNSNDAPPKEAVGRKRTNGVPPKKTPEQMNRELGERFTNDDAVHPSIVVMNNARVAITNAQNHDRLDKCDQSADAACGEGRINQTQRDELKTLITKRRMELDKRAVIDGEPNTVPRGERAAAAT